MITCQRCMGRIIRHVVLVAYCRHRCLFHACVYSNSWSGWCVGTQLFLRYCMVVCGNVLQCKVVQGISCILSSCHGHLKHAGRDVQYSKAPQACYICEEKKTWPWTNTRKTWQTYLQTWAVSYLGPRVGQCGAGKNWLPAIWPNIALLLHFCSSNDGRKPTICQVWICMHVKT